MSKQERAIGKSIIELPQYMTALPQAFIDLLLQTRIQDDPPMIFACGIDPGDNNLVVVTLDLEVLCIAPNGKTIPEAAFPHFDGCTISMKMKDIDDIVSLSSETVVKSATSCWETTSGISVALEVVNK